MRVAFRIYIDGKLDFEEVHDIEPDSNDLQLLADKHMMRILGHEVWLCEAEVLDDPDDPERFMRFGTDTSLMVNPIDDPSQHPWAGGV